MTPGLLELSLFRLGVGTILFLGINWLGRHSSVFGYQTVTMFSEPEEEALAFNIVFRVVTPVVGLILVSALCYAVGLDAYTTRIHWAILFYVGIRCAYSVGRGWFLLLPWSRVLAQWVLMFSLGWFTYDKLIRHRNLLLPDMQNVSNEVWLAVVAYLYVLASKVATEDKRKQARVHRHVRSRFLRFQDRFGSIVNGLTTNLRFQAVVYGVMLVEDFNRPALTRAAERVAFRLGLAKTTGVMQVGGDRPSSDENSVRVGVARLISDWRAVAAEGKWKVSERSRAYYSAEQTITYEEQSAVHLTLTRYNPSGDYARDVEAVAEQIRKEFFPQAAEPLHPTTTQI